MSAFIKRLNNFDTGDASHVGGVDWDFLDQYLSGVDISPKIPEINTKTVFKDGKLWFRDSTNTYTYTLLAGSLSNNVTLFLPDADDDITLVAAGGANDWGAALQTFRNTYLALRNPANTASYIVNTGAITSQRNIIIPALGADDTLTFNNFAAIFQNKTLDIDTNTLKHSSTNADGDILVYDTASGKYIRLPRGTADQVLKVNSGGTNIEWGADSGAGIGSDQLYTNLTSTNGYKYGLWSSPSDSHGYGLLADITDFDVASTGYIDTTNGFTGASWTMSGTTNKVGWWTTDPITIRKLNPDLEFCFLLNENADNVGSRFYLGFIDDSSFSTTDTILNNQSGFMLYKSSVNSFFEIGHNDGSASATYSGSIQSSDSLIHTIRLFADEANTRFGYQLDGGTINYISTAIPSSTDQLHVVINASNSDATTRNLRGFWAKMKMQERV